MADWTVTSEQPADEWAVVNEQPMSRRPGAVQQTLVNLGTGAIRGAGSIGATLIRPFESAEANRQRRADIEQSLVDIFGADPDSLAYQGGKLGTEIAGTAGVGGVVARPIAGMFPRLAQALQSGGFRAGGATGPQGIAMRTAGGAVAGGSAAGLVNPEDAGAGAVIGGLIPGGVQIGGRVGQAVGSKFRAPPQSADEIRAIREARRAGYVIPPTQANPSLLNRTLEGTAGKITTGQLASAKNQSVTNRLAAKALGLPEDTKIDAETLRAVRQQAGQAYDAVAATGAVRPDESYHKALDDIVRPYLVSLGSFPNRKPSEVITLVDSLRSDVFDADAAIATISQLRSQADDAFRTGNKDLGAAAREGASVLEDALDKHLIRIGAPPETLNNYRNARQLIAKSYSVENALNPTTGTIDARKLAGQLNKRRPLSGELRDVADFANRFPKAAQTPEQMGSLPGFSPLDFTAGTGLGVLGSIATGSPMGMLGGLAVTARPVARSVALSDLVQNRLVNQPAAPRLPGSVTLSELLGRSAPVALTADQ